MTEPNLDRILQKIKKLLALATSSNIHESCAAGAMAQEIIEKYRLSSDLIRGLQETEETPEEIVNFADYDVYLFEVERPLYAWEGFLSVVLSEANNCKVWAETATQPGGKNITRIGLVGTLSDAKLTTHMFHLLLVEITRLSEISIEEIKKANKPIPSVEMWHNGFRYGAVKEIETRLKALKGKVEEEFKEEFGHALIHVSNAIAKQEKRKKDVETFFTSKFAIVPASNHYWYDTRAHAAGVVAANQLDLAQNAKLEMPKKFLTE